MDGTEWGGTPSSARSSESARVKALISVGRWARALSSTIMIPLMGSWVRPALVRQMRLRDLIYGRAAARNVTRRTHFPQGGRNLVPPTRIALVPAGSFRIARRDGESARLKCLNTKDLTGAEAQSCGHVGG
jgi:hypothetical protein